MIVGIMVFIAILSSAGICWGSNAFQNFTWLWMLPVTSLGMFIGIGLLLFLIWWMVTLTIPMNKPVEKDSRFFRLIADLAIEFSLEMLQVRIHVEGKEKMPAQGRFLLVSNHLEILDPLVMMSVLPKSQLAFIAKQEVRRLVIAGPLMYRLMGQFINRENDREALKTILRCIQIIKEDKASVSVFPEGYTSLDGKLHGFRSGVFKIAQKAQVPIVVCTLRNTQYIFKNAIRLRPTTVDMHIVEVLPAPPMRGVTATEIGDQVHALMAADLGPELVGTLENPAIEASRQKLDT